MPLDQSEIIERLERSAVNDTGVADQCHDFIIFLLLRLPYCHPDCGCYGGPCMADDELVVGAFSRVGKAAYPASLAEELELVFPAGNDFVRIALMADVPEQLIFFEIEDVVQRQRQFHHTEIAGQVSAGLRDRVENELAYFVGQGV